MAQDTRLDNADSASAEVWAPVHARRALGRLRAEPAIEPLLGLLPRIDDDDDDWIDDLSNVFGQIGAAALAQLEAYVAARQHPLHARGIASEGLVSVGKRHPSGRDAAVAALTRLLGNFAEPGRDPALNAFLVAGLVELDAVEAAPLMQRAFAARQVEEDVVGDWQAVQVELGLKDERDASRWGQSHRPEPAGPLPVHVRPQASPLAAKPAPPKKPATAQPVKTQATPPASGPKRNRHRHKK